MCEEEGGGRREEGGLRDVRACNDQQIRYGNAAASKENAGGVVLDGRQVPFKVLCGSKSRDARGIEPTKAAPERDGPLVLCPQQGPLLISRLRTGSRAAWWRVVMRCDASASSGRRVRAAEGVADTSANQHVTTSMLGSKRVLER